MAFYNDAWFIHGVNTAVHVLAQQTGSKVRGSVRTNEGVTGKTWPYQMIGSLDMVPVTTRDADTTYLNPPQSKRRAVLVDRAAAVLIDDLDKVREMINPQSEYTRMLFMAREREVDKLVVGIEGLTAAGAAGTAVGGAIGLATTVDEAGETSSTASLPAAQQIVNGGTGMTMAKVLDAREIFDGNDVPEDEQYFFYSSKAVRKLLTDTQVTSADYNTVKALTEGRFPMDATWMGFKWRRVSNAILPKSGNIRSCIALQKDCVGLAIGLLTDFKANEAPHKWNNIQVVGKLSLGSVRIDDKGVVQVDIDESA